MGLTRETSSMSLLEIFSTSIYPLYDHSVILSDPVSYNMYIHAHLSEILKLYFLES